MMLFALITTAALSSWAISGIQRHPSLIVFVLIVGSISHKAMILSARAVVPADVFHHHDAIRHSEDPAAPGHAAIWNFLTSNIQEKHAGTGLSSAT